MDSKENPPYEPPSDSSGPVEAILVPDQESASELDSSSDAQSSVVSAQLVEESPVPNVSSVKTQDNLLQANLAAQGGAVASIVLGILSIIGASITPYSVINAVLGLALGFWGMSSNARWPWLGIALSTTGIVFCAASAVGG